MLRLLYLEHVNGKTKVADMIAQWNDSDRMENEAREVFEDTAKGWRMVACLTKRQTTATAGTAGKWPRLRKPLRQAQMNSKRWRDGSSRLIAAGQVVRGTDSSVPLTAIR